MKIRFFQGWTDQELKLGDIRFLNLAWSFEEDFNGNKFFSVLLIIFNFGVQIDIG